MRPSNAVRTVRDAEAIDTSHLRLPANPENCYHPRESGVHLGNPTKGTLTVKGLMEVPMVKIILILVGTTAVPTFGAGIWTLCTLSKVVGQHQRGERRYRCRSTE